MFYASLYLIRKKMLFCQNSMQVGLRNEKKNIHGLIRCFPNTSKTMNIISFKVLCVLWFSMLHRKPATPTSLFKYTLYPRKIFNETQLSMFTCS